MLLVWEEQFHLRLRNWYWHSAVAIWAPRVASRMISGSLVQKLRALRRCLWAIPTVFPCTIKFDESLLLLLVLRQILTGSKSSWLEGGSIYDLKYNIRHNKNVTTVCKKTFKTVCKKAQDFFRKLIISLCVAVCRS